MITLIKIKRTRGRVTRGLGIKTTFALVERALVERALVERALVERALVERALVERALVERALAGVLLYTKSEVHLKLFLLVKYNSVPN